LREISARTYENEPVQGSDRPSIDLAPTLVSQSSALGLHYRGLGCFALNAMMDRISIQSATMSKPPVSRASSTIALVIWKLSKSAPIVVFPITCGARIEAHRSAAKAMSP